ncbi:SEL1-like repeat protein [Methylophilaceae bacterium]|jgi:TPR repeat protein|nr:SEL1-like repeat protein [Methylophilaceae bacterium]
MSKNEKDWFATLAGEKVVGMDSKIRLQAKLVRNVLKKKSDEINKDINKDNEQHRKVFISKLEEVGYLKKASTDLKQKIRDNIKWLLTLLMGGSLFTYAMKDGIHITDIQAVPTTQIEVTETFWNIVMDETGNRLIAFWPKQKKQITKTKTTIVDAVECSSELLTLNGCLKLQNKHQAQFNIGLIYEQGLSGVEKNPNKAYEWYKKSAEQGNQRAKFNMEYMISKEMIDK